MKSILLVSSLALAVSSALAAPGESSAPSTPAPPTKPAASVSSHVTVTIESSGKKETHEIDLGNASTLKIHGPDTVTISDAPTNTGENKKSGGGDVGATISGIVQAALNGLGAQPASGPTPWLGVTMEPVSEELRAQLPLEAGAGLVLRSVAPDSPAAQAGLQIHDVLVKLDDQLLINSNQLSALVQMKKDGEKVRLTYFRGGKPSTAEVQIRMHERKYTGTTSLNALSNLGEMVVTDKDGHVLVSRTPPDLGAVTAQVENILRAAGVDDKTITETELTIEQAAKAASNVVSSIGNIGNGDGDAAGQIKYAADQVAKALEKARATAEHARQQAEEARERAEKQANPQKSPSAQ
jgi:membrane-associated protease RseP (regulator of RpoE activity)